MILSGVWYIQPLVSGRKIVNFRGLLASVGFSYMIAKGLFLFLRVLRGNVGAWGWKLENMCVPKESRISAYREPYRDVISVEQK